MLVIYGVLGVKNAGTGWDGTRAMGWVVYKDRPGSFFGRDQDKKVEKSDGTGIYSGLRPGS